MNNKEIKRLADKHYFSLSKLSELMSSKQALEMITKIRQENEIKYQKDIEEYLEKDIPITTDRLMKTINENIKQGYSHFGTEYLVDIDTAKIIIRHMKLEKLGYKIKIDWSSETERMSSSGYIRPFAFLEIKIK